MSNKFDEAYKKSEETNQLLKKIESRLGNTRKELAQNLKEMDAMVAKTPKAN